MLGSFILGDYACGGILPRAVHHAVFQGFRVTVMVGFVAEIAIAMVSYGKCQALWLLLKTVLQFLHHRGKSLCGCAYL